MLRVSIPSFYTSPGLCMHPAHRRNLALIPSIGGHTPRQGSAVKLFIRGALAGRKKGCRCSRSTGAPWEPVGSDLLFALQGARP